MWTRCWDLDFLEELGGHQYALLKNAYPESEDKLSVFDNTVNGTVILWENMDRIVDDYHDVDEGKNSFYKSIDDVENYIKMVFHRFIDIGGKVNIFICQKNEIKKKIGKVSGWDPFLIKKKKFQEDCGQMDQEL